MNGSFIKKSWSVIDIINWGNQYFEDNKIDSPRLNIESILIKILGCKRIDLYVGFDKPLTEKELACVKDMVSQRVSGKPLQYILGEVEFYNAVLKVVDGVFIPRPETELLVGFFLKEYNSKKMDNEPVILELGAGTGNISVAIAKNLSRCKIFSVDISKKALDLASDNSHLNNVSDKIRFFKADMMADWNRNTDMEFDYIVSNPPYIPLPDKDLLSREVIDFEPHEALFAGDDGLDFYNRIITYFCCWLKKGGMVFLELGIGQAEKVAVMLRDNGFSDIVVEKDYHGIQRVIYAVK